MVFPSFPSLRRASRQLPDTATVVASFDIFDTVLTRVVTEPPSVWLLLGRRLAASGRIDATPEAFMRMRRAAQDRIHRNGGWREFTLRQVYAELAAHLGLEAAEAEAMIAEEYRVESELLRAVPGAHELVEEMRRLGRQVVFLSDMYLDGEFLREQLRVHGLFRDGDRCYVSCELGHPKRTGEAFRVMAGLHGIEVRHLVHHGNHAESDIRGGQRAGARTCALYGANPNRFERLLEAHVFDTEGLSAVLAGASRLARLSVAAATPEHAVVRDVTAGVIAPALTGYLLWVLLRAQRMGLRRLHFLPGNGRVLREIAGRLAQRLGADLELHYLEGSREAWLRAAHDPRGGRALLAYLAQEEVLGGAAGMVGMAGAGEQVRALASIADGGAAELPPTFVFSAAEARDGDRGCRFVPYFSSASERYGFIDIDAELLLKALCPADEPGRGGLWEGVAWRTLQAFVENLHLDRSLVNLAADARPALAAALAAASADPTADEARVCGSLLAGGETMDGENAASLRPYGIAQIAFTLRSGAIGSDHGGEWRAGRLAVTPRPIRSLLRAAAYVGRGARALVRRIDAAASGSRS